MKQKEPKPYTKEGDERIEFLFYRSSNNTVPAIMDKTGFTYSYVNTTIDRIIKSKFRNRIINKIKN